MKGTTAIVRQEFGRGRAFCFSLHPEMIEGFEGIVPSPPAEARVFIRRATFDLTGLPPTPEEVSERILSVGKPMAGLIRDLHVTLLHLLGLNDNKLTYLLAGRYKLLSQFGGEVIREFLA